MARGQLTVVFNLEVQDRQVLLPSPWLWRHTNPLPSRFTGLESRSRIPVMTAHQRGNTNRCPTGPTNDPERGRQPKVRRRERRSDRPVSSGIHPGGPDHKSTIFGPFLDNQPILNRVRILFKADGRSIGDVSESARSLSIVAMNSSRMPLLSFRDEVRYRCRTDASPTRPTPKFLATS